MYTPEYDRFPRLIKFVKILNRSISWNCVQVCLFVSMTYYSDNLPPSDTSLSSTTIFLLHTILNGKKLE